MFSADCTQELRAALGDAVEFDVPLAKKVAFKIGGPADAFVRAFRPAQLREALRIAAQFEVPVTLLGTGANVLISDAGLRGVVIRLDGEFRDVHLTPNPESAAVHVSVGAGALNSTVVSLLLNSGVVGLEFLATIPGTFGGALIMNAGAHGQEIRDVLTDVQLLRPDGQAERRAAESCGFVYRGSNFAAGEVLLGADLVLARGDASAARVALQEMRARRKSTQPIGKPNAGSIFKNPSGDHAGRLIEACGLKGTRVGGAEISPVHANFIVNVEHAKASDVCALAATAQHQVRDRFGVELEWEVKRLGRFKSGTSEISD